MSNEEVLRDHFEAAQRREDWPRAMDAYDESVVLAAQDSGGGPAVFQPGVFFGKRDVGRWFADWIGTFEDVEFDLVEMEQGPDALAAHARHTARGRASGLAIEADLYYAYWFRQGRIVRVEVANSRESAWRAAGLAG